MKILLLKVNLLNSSISISAFLRLYISYNLICEGREGQGAFFFLCSIADNHDKMWYETSCMTSLSMENINNTCRAFYAFYILMKVPCGEVYQSAMFSNASIATWDMQGRSCSNIIMYKGAMKWLDSLAMNPW